jgi:hypothetical protein
MDEMYAWHFLPADRCLRFIKPKKRVEPGIEYVHDGAIELGKEGFHASVRAIDALTCAPGPIEE